MNLRVDTRQIYIAMAEKGLNGNELAQAAGVSQQAVSQVLNGQRRGTTKVLGALCKALELSVKDVLIVEDNPQGGRPTRVYQLNEPQATLLITYLDNTKIVREFKKRLVQQFYQMRALVQQLQSPVWQDTRALTKESRKKETEAIRQLVEYARANGSQNAVRYYTSLSVLADQAAGIPPKGRDAAGIEELTRLYLVESMIDRCIQEGITRLLPYKDIYRGCKAQLLQFSALTCQG